MPGRGAGLLAAPRGARRWRRPAGLGDGQWRTVESRSGAAMEATRERGTGEAPHLRAFRFFPRSTPFSGPASQR